MNAMILGVASNSYLDVTACIHAFVKDGSVSWRNQRSRFRRPKTAEDESNLLKESIPKSTVYKNKRVVKDHHSGS